MLSERHFSIHQQVRRKETQPPCRSDRRIQHPHRPSRRVPRIHKNLPANPLLLPVQRLESLLRHHHFAANFKIRRQFHLLQCRRIHPQRNRPDRLHVRRHLFPCRPIAARRATCPHSTLILKRNAQPIELVFRDVSNLLLPASLSHPPVPFPQCIVR